MAKPTFYFDESVEISVSQQLEIYGIDVVSVHGLGLLGQSDINHLQRAAALGQVLCTYDSDFVVLASEGVEHAGIVKATRTKMTIGQWIRDIRIKHARFDADSFINRVIYLPLK